MNRWISLYCCSWVWCMFSSFLRCNKNIQSVKIFPPFALHPILNTDVVFKKISYSSNRISVFESHYTIYSKTVKLLSMVMLLFWCFREQAHTHIIDNLYMESIALKSQREKHLKYNMVMRTQTILRTCPKTLSKIIHWCERQRQHSNKFSMASHIWWVEILLRWFSV